MDITIKEQVVGPKSYLINTRISNDQHIQLDDLSKRTHKSHAALVREAVAYMLRNANVVE